MVTMDLSKLHSSLVITFGNWPLSVLVYGDAKTGCKNLFKRWISGAFGVGRSGSVSGFALFVTLSTWPAVLAGCGARTFEEYENGCGKRMVCALIHLKTLFSRWNWTYFGVELRMLFPSISRPFASGLPFPALSGGAGLGMAARKRFCNGFLKYPTLPYLSPPKIKGVR